ncbi:hypothetical protein [Pseudochrobactrum saccharolyticum]|uniref:Uncharacterized protein n=1 Tax=Pseudochrobactrum saccharolyticum TaxID=354352 RepID=A0A7W8AIE7_9HYPH|nr:hypothetical protein [Pseudochrobactrum saccharolyticum]KAB0539150.1 hypothetical protein F7P81_08910 [Pseudochrobactrum saccharolyticum]MBB5090830.1 hypothetical protein [Pseudochrobactrum saccharolyticum]MDP8249494.1 hypothetical protein [Pseudochrobactrum saccharolyticum]
MFRIGTAGANIGKFSGISHANNGLPESFFKRISFGGMNRPSVFFFRTQKSSNMHDMSAISAPQHGEKPEKTSKNPLSHQKQ